MIIWILKKSIFKSEKIYELRKIEKFQGYREFP